MALTKVVEGEKMKSELKYLLLSTVIDVDQRIMKAIKNQINSDSKVVYIRGKSSSSNKFFTDVCNFYKQLGINNVEYYDLDHNYNQADLQAIEDCDMIHLGGGNTYIFNQRVKDGNYYHLFQNILRSDKLVIGESAGAIILTKDIGITAILGEENKSIDSTGLGLLKLQFLPHYNALNAKQVGLIEDYQSVDNGPIIVTNDGGGVLFDSEDIRLVDSVYIK